MKHDLTTGTWQDDTGCPISIVLAAASDVSGNLSTLSGDTVSAVVSDVAISFNNAYVIKRDWMFDNGIIHVIDRVLLPPSDPLPAKLTKFNDLPTEVHRT